MFDRFNKAVLVASAVCLVGATFAADEVSEFRDKDFRKSGFEKRLYYALEKTEDLTPFQKESIRRALKEYQQKKDRQALLNAKKFQADELQKEYLKSMALDSAEEDIAGRESLLNSIHKTLTPKQREQFLKKYQGMIN